MKEKSISKHREDFHEKASQFYERKIHIETRRELS